MNILFVTLSSVKNINKRGIYTDLLRKFREEGHNITIVTPSQRRQKLPTAFLQKDGVSILRVKTLNITKTHVIEKGIGTLAIEYQYLFAIKKYLKHVKFDLVLYTTPPITLVKVIEFIKNRDKAYAYLLLKDIFPQNAVDMQMIKNNGFLHRHFVKKEKRLYKVSDTIGCMSPANVKFIKKHNPEIDPNKLEVNPNSIEPISYVIKKEDQIAIREKYELPIDRKIFVYGGNLGKPQGVNFLLDCIAAVKNKNAYFVIVGNGTEFKKIQNWFNNEKPTNASLLQHLPKKDYDQLLMSCDIGLIFLHKDFLIPNFPSRLLSYLEMKKPIIAATDPNADIGSIIEDAKCGYRLISDDIKNFVRRVDQILEDDLGVLGENGYKLLQEQYLVGYSYQLITEKLAYE